MELPAIDFYYPAKEKDKYVTKKTKFLTEYDDPDDFFSNPNIVDFICETMILVIIDKYSDSAQNMSQKPTNFLKKARKFQSMVYEQLLSFYTENNDFNSLKIEKESEELTKGFIEIMGE